MNENLTQFINELKRGHISDEVSALANAAGTLTAEFINSLAAKGIPDTMRTDIACYIGIQLLHSLLAANFATGASKNVPRSLVPTQEEAAEILKNLNENDFFKT